MSLASLLLLVAPALAETPPAAASSPDALCSLVTGLQPDVVRHYKDFATLDNGPKGWAATLGLPDGACAVDAHSGDGRCVLGQGAVPSLRESAWAWAERLQACAVTPADASRFPMDPFSFPDPTGKALVRIRKPNRAAVLVEAGDGDQGILVLTLD